MPDESRQEQMVGQYLIVRELGRGGQAIVYLAQDLQHSRLAALKVYADPRLVGILPISENSIRRFRREAGAASKVEHPSLCKIYEAGEHDGVPYLAMEYIEGKTLAELIEAGRMELEHTGNVERRRTRWFTTAQMPFLRLFEKVAEALHLTHEASLVHRDIKPANIILTSGQRPVILDFGLVRDVSVESSLTALGDEVGTAIYMPPELLNPLGATPDARTDIYSLGVTLYEALCLETPFDTQDRSELRRRIRHGAVQDLTELLPSISSSLRSVITRAMAPDVRNRYATAADFASDLRRARRGEPVEALKSEGIGRFRRWIVGR